MNTATATGTRSPKFPPWTANVQPPVQECGVRKKKAYRKLWVPDETIGFLGKARLVRKANGKCDLIGGSEAEREFARKWCGRFAAFLEFTEPAMQELALAA